MEVMRKKWKVYLRIWSEIFGQPSAPRRKVKSAIEQTRIISRPALDMLEKLTEEEVQSEEGMLTKKEAIVTIVNDTYGGNAQEMESVFEDMVRDLWSTLSAKAEGKAEEKMEGCQQREGLQAYLRIHLWFTRTTAQGRSDRRAGIMSSARCKNEREISAAIERWEE